MKEKISELIYLTRSLCDHLNDKPDMIDIDEDLKEILIDIEECLDTLSFADDAESLDSED